MLKTQDLYEALSQKLPWVGVRKVRIEAYLVEFENGDLKTPTLLVDEGFQVEIGSASQNFLIYMGGSSEDVSWWSHQALLAKERADKLEKISLGPLPLNQVRLGVPGYYRELTPSRFVPQNLFREWVSFLRHLANRPKPEGVDQTHFRLALTHRYQEYLNSSGANIEQEFWLWEQGGHVLGISGGSSQVRSFSPIKALCRQGEPPPLDESVWIQALEVACKDLQDLLQAKPCPSGVMDLILDPHQMLLQIHESIGHPLELDRILGDELNYAGGSFLKLSDFGHLQYGSPLLNVVFDPSDPLALASYGFDDSGLKAEKVYLIREGILLRPLGGLESSYRSGLPALANFRQASWNRAPIDRMANIDVEPGTSSFEEMIRSVELGVCMATNRSWSIDDQRNKFQFGCEWGRMIRNGKLAEVVRNPGYRGETIPFWRSLVGVGSPATWNRDGTPYCGKGEPSQVIWVSHGSPVCHFRGVEVFG